VLLVETQVGGWRGTDGAALEHRVLAAAASI
jgi:hypothetical protein